MISKANRLLGAILLVSGTTIGAGMLALPVTTGQAGFFPSVVIITFMWLFMMLTAFYFLEVNLRMKGESNFISMVHKTLGKRGEVISWITYLLLLYSLTAAYMVGSAQILQSFINPLLPFTTPEWVWPIVIFVIFGLFVYCGTLVADFFNRVLMFGLVISYLAFLVIGSCCIDIDKLGYVDWHFLLPSISVVVTAFGYHIIIPTLSTYLEHDSRLLKKAIFIGSLVPFLFYLLWQVVVIGIVPVYGEYSLTSSYEQGTQITEIITRIVSSTWLALTGRFLSLFAIITSLLGVSLSLMDFLADGLKVKKSHRGKLLLILITFIPPLLFALFYPNGFIMALEYAGIFVVILLALLPTLMAWFERYKKKGFVDSDFKVFGGKPLMIIAVVISCVLLGVEILI